MSLIPEPAAGQLAKDAAIRAEAIAEYIAAKKPQTLEMVAINKMLEGGPDNGDCN